MPACEKCWDDAFRRTLTDSNKSQADHYADLLKEREHNPCSPRQQSGEYRDDEDKLLEGGEDGCLERTKY
jgi:hypothetical protein